MNLAGHKLARITHLDPIGLCFGRLFSEAKFRLSPSDASDTRAVHVSLNLFDNPLDGVHSNFLVNGGRDQIGCGGQSELHNSTSSSIALLYDQEAKFVPCSHLRALSLYEDDLSSQPEQCQIVGYLCDSYDRFLAGKCGKCDANNRQCRLMSFQPLQVEQQSLEPRSELHPPFSGFQRFLQSVDKLKMEMRDAVGNQSEMLDAPSYFVGTGAVSPFCVNYYQVRILVDANLLASLARSDSLASRRRISSRRLGASYAVEPSTGEEQLKSLGSRRDQLHMTVKLTDSQGRYFKGFTLIEDANQLLRTSSQQVEITMLLNTTRLEPVRISQSIISYYFHRIVRADSIEVNYMSNISPT